MNPKEMKQRRQFYGLLTVVLAAVAGVKLYHGKTNTALVLGAVAVLPLSLEFAIPRLSALLFRRWMKFGEWLGMVNSYLIVGLMFLFILTPVGLLLRLMGKYRQYDRESRKRRSSWVTLHDPRPLASRYHAPY